VAVGPEWGELRWPWGMGELEVVSRVHEAEVVIGEEAEERGGSSGPWYDGGWLRWSDWLDGSEGTDIGVCGALIAGNWGGGGDAGERGGGGGGGGGEVRVE